MYFSIGNYEAESVVDTYFSEVKQMIMSSKFDDDISIVLTGSLARGEGTWTYVDNRIELISDIEYLVVYSNKSALHEVRKLINSFNDNYNFTNEHFHIDCSFILRKSLKKLDKKLFVYETKKMGQVLYGNDDLALIPDINQKNFYYEDLFDIINHRFFSIIKSVNKSKNLHECSAYAIARNGLDLLTVYIFNEGILIPGYKNRFNYLEEIIENTVFTDDFIEFQRKCLHIKENYQISHIDTRAFLNDFLHFSDIVVKLLNTKRIPNVLISLPSAAKSKLGALKRFINGGNFIISKKQHYKKMRSYLKELLMTTEVMSSYERICMDNYTLYGYPKINNSQRE